MRLRKVVLATAAGVLAPTSFLAMPAVAAEHAAPSAVSADPARQSAGEAPDQHRVKSTRPRVLEFDWQDRPESIEAGGGWAEGHLIVDNSNSALKEDYAYKLRLWIMPVAPRTGDYQVQVFFDGAWRDAEPTDSGASGLTEFTMVESVGFPAERVVIPIRVKANADIAPTAPTDHVSLRAVLNWPYGQQGVTAETKITAPDPGGEEPGNGEHTSEPSADPAPQPGPGEGTTPPVHETATPAGDRPEQSATDGALAETGTDRPAAWALGMGGTAALLAGVVLIGIGRRRRQRRSA